MVHGWWDLNIGDCELSDGDREHIAEMIKEGYTSGEICHEEKVEGCMNCKKED